MVSLKRRASEASVPKPRLYHHFLRARITREQRQAIQEYAKCHGLRWGEAVRELIELGLPKDSSIDNLSANSLDRHIVYRLPSTLIDTLSMEVAINS